MEAKDDFSVKECDVNHQFQFTNGQMLLTMFWCVSRRDEPSAQTLTAPVKESIREDGRDRKWNLENLEKPSLFFYSLLDGLGTAMWDFKHH